MKLGYCNHSGKGPFSATTLLLLWAFTGAQEAVAATTTDFQYDALGRLTTVAQGTSQTSYAYDAAGNRSSKQVSTIVPTAITLSSQAPVLEHQGNVVLQFNVGTSSTTGAVSFYKGATLIGTSNVVNGVANLEVGGLPAGTNTVTVAYAGNGTVTANSASLTFKVVNIDWLPAVLELLLN